MTLLCHFRQPQFQQYAGSLAHRSDVTSAVQEAAGSLDEIVNNLFQQTVYAVTKVTGFVYNILPLPLVMYLLSQFSFLSLTE